MISFYGTLYWPGFCSPSYEYFWDYDSVFQSHQPQIAVCFQKSIMVWIPCGFFLIASLFYLPYLYRLQRVANSVGYCCASLLKLFFILATIIVQIVHSVQYMSRQYDNSVVDFIEPCVYGISFVVLFLITCFEYFKDVQSSSVTVLFLFMVSISNTIIFLTNKQYLELEYPAFVVFFSLVIFLLILWSFGDPQETPRPLPDAPNEEPVYSFDVVEDNDTTTLIGSEEHNTDEEAVLRPRCPSDRISFWRKISFSYVIKLLRLGYKNALEESNLWQLHKGGDAKSLVKKFQKEFNLSGVQAYSRTIRLDSEPYLPPGARLMLDPWYQRGSIIKALCKTFGRSYAMVGLYELMRTLCTFCRPIVLGCIINFVQDEDSITWKGYFYTLLLVFLSITSTILNQQYFYGKNLIGMRIRATLCAAIYRKTLRLSSSRAHAFGVGHISTLMSSDTQKIEEFVYFLHNLWSSLFNIIIAVVLLYLYIGKACFAGMVVMLLMVSMNVLLTYRVKKIQASKMRLTDKRTKRTQEMLSGIKELKLYAWEEVFTRRIEQIRKLELSEVLKFSYCLSGTVISLSCAPILFAMVAFTTYIAVSSSHELSAEVIFVTLALIASLTKPLTFLPKALSSAVQASVSRRRIEEYLGQKEISNYRTLNTTNAITFQDSSFSYNWENPQFRLSEIDLPVRKATLVVVLGAVGSGKTSLLNAILGEMEIHGGGLSLKGSIAYVPQIPWIQNATIEKNILLNQKMNRMLYDRVIEACDLLDDINTFKKGDQTEIGEKGINLSGGQKHRLSLARALFQNADIYLFDDPLSAVDSKVAAYIFNNVMGPYGLLQDKTRVLVTHNTAFLEDSDHIIVMDQGTIEESGTYTQLMHHNYKLPTHMREFEEEAENKDIINLAEYNSFKRKQRALTINSIICDNPNPDFQVENQRPLNQAAGRLIVPENAQRGRVKLSIIWAYLKRFGVPTGLILLICILSMGSCEIASNIWLSQWSNDIKVNKTENPHNNLPFRVGIYFLIGFIQILAVLLHAIFVSYGCYKVAGSLHSRMLQSILHAKLCFFDTTPLGRILNRFSSDLNTVDYQIRFTLVAAIKGILGIICTIVIITYASYYFIILVVPLAVIYYLLQTFYIRTSNRLKRMMTIASSALFTDFESTISGAVSIRSYCLQSQYCQVNEEHIDALQRARHVSNVAERWLSIWLEFLGCTVILFTCIFAINVNNLDAGITGLAIHFALLITDKLAFFIKNMSDLEKNTVSVERIIEYTQLPSEDLFNKDDDDYLSYYWPDQGVVHYINYATSYREGLPLILKDISFRTGPYEKIGIVGRTGSGKSTLSLSLFRILESLRGDIVIDGINIKEIGLHKLRKNIAIVPQDPFLFSGTVRFNLDPNRLHGDHTLWDLLLSVCWVESNFNREQGLNFVITESGSNLSVGQKQLLCLARAVLNKSRIIVLDEATSAMDRNTEMVIQGVIDRHFSNCTVFTIAHRLETIIDYDRILVIDKGKIVEFDTPSSLLKCPISLFRGMCEEANVKTDGNED